MVRSKEELLKAINEIEGIPEDTSISLIEDITDTMDSFSDQTNWRTKYEENDAQWKKKYKERFFNSDSKDNNSEQEFDEPEKKPLTFESLFGNG